MEIYDCVNSDRFNLYYENENLDDRFLEQMCATCDSFNLNAFKKVLTVRHRLNPGTDFELVRKIKFVKSTKIKFFDTKNQILTTLIIKVEAKSHDLSMKYVSSDIALQKFIFKILNITTVI